MKRQYVITISTKTTKGIEPILFHNLNYNEQIGVIGHELSHVCEYTQYNFFQLAGLSFRMMSRKAEDVFERKTDSICIRHGLGYQLLEWSKAVRKKLQVENWEGANLYHRGIRRNKERYMNPASIILYMEVLPIYRKEDIDLKK
jgi:predicted metallopeptidase